MKAIYTAYKLFKSQIISNIIIIVYFVIFCSISIILVNQYSQRIACYSMINKSAYQMFYVNLSEEMVFSVDPSEYFSMRDSIRNIAEKLNGYIGISSTFETLARVNTDRFLSETYCSVYMIDEITSSALKYKMTKGSWLSNCDIVDGLKPCVIAGNFSNVYNIGDKLTITFQKTSQIEDDYKSLDTLSETYYVAGIFDNNQMVFNKSLKSSSKPQPLSYYFDQLNDNNLLIWTEHTYSSYQILEHMDANIISSLILYFERSLSSISTSDIIKTISDVNIYSQAELLENEKLAIASDYEIIFPTIMIMLIISIVGIYSICLLNILKNTNRFAINYLCGCSIKNNILIVAIYSLFFSIFALICLC